MSERFVEMLREKFDTDAWLRPQPLDVHVFTVGFKLFEVNGLRPEHRQTYDTPSDDQLLIEEAQKRPLPTTEWTFVEGGALFVLTAYECESRMAARAQLLRVLGGFQGADVERVPIVGEIAFIVPHGWSAVMQRGNLVFFAHNGTRELKSVLPMLQTIDGTLLREPSYRDPLIVDISPPEPEGLVSLGFTVPDEEEWYHILVRGGELRSTDLGKLLFRFTRAGTDGIVNVVRISPRGNAGARFVLR